MDHNWRNNECHRPTIYRFLEIMINDRLPDLSVWHDKEAIRVVGNFHDPDWLTNYDVGIEYKIGTHPRAYILNQKIQPSSRIHMYPNGSLCLYHARNVSHLLRFTLVFDIIPWCIKWIHFYEIWKRNGNLWIGPEVPHF